jgi:hypothetical protein
LSSLAVISLFRDEKRMLPPRNIVSPCQIGVELVTPIKPFGDDFIATKLLSCESLAHIMQTVSWGGRLSAVIHSGRIELLYTCIQA